MAAAAEQLKDKKKNRFRERFLLTQAASLDEVMTSSTGECSPGNTTTDGTSRCSRMRRLLFRRTRSETEDQTRNSRLNKTDSIISPTPEQVGLRVNFTPESSVSEEVSDASSTLPHLHSLMPRSPPPPYDKESQSNTPRLAGVCPPTYDEAMAQNGPNDQNGPNLPTMGSNLPIGYCNCRECQARYFNSEEEEQDDNCADAVFPMETHVLMQEVLADGMAFCSVM
ncbi:uncharacterized protein LOC130694677 isoform X1 [Daphnia carinata]|uniref:uncharacterized protein LOC130694677 isoform X1 n=1 Tax=Daphnia carinata TaxID=120202 RepID=UPI00257C56BD|nr:uncharacterized protein LOC130694677 isoform X1 [Daphnia carinata]XP_057373757.1 uncharacterized protein LOC130694677 isoform X1 [Daphnia carinata]